MQTGSKRITANVTDPGVNPVHPTPDVAQAKPQQDAIEQSRKRRKKRAKAKPPGSLGTFPEHNTI